MSAEVLQTTLPIAIILVCVIACGVMFAVGRRDQAQEPTSTDSSNSATPAS